MPKGSWKPPEAGDAPQEVKNILKKVYSDYRDKHGGENPATKTRGAKIAWAAVKNAGWHKVDGKWTKAKKEMADVEAKDFVIFKAGTWNGETFTEADLDNMAKSFNAEEPIPIIIGHGSDYKGHTRIPAFGQILGGLVRVGKDLIARGAVFNEKLANWIKEGFYNQRSIELTKDNKRVLAVGMLGAVPPAVKGLPAMDEALNDIALEYADNTETKVIEFADAGDIEMTAMDEIEGLATDDTMKTLEECLGRFAENVEECLTQDYDAESIMAEVWKLQGDLVECLNLHNQFIKKIEQIEEDQESEYSEQTGWKEFVDRVKNLFNKHKEQDVDQIKEKEYKDEIAALKTQVKEFTDAKIAAEQAKLAADQAAQEAAKVAADEALKNEIKAFCDNLAKEGKITPAIREKDEPIMFNLAKTSPEALKSFQEKYTVSVVPLGTAMKEEKEDNDTRSQVIKDAEKYAVAHKTDKEFAGLDKDSATNRAVYLHSIGKITFESK
jgi:hypothetical protein